MRPGQFGGDGELGTRGRLTLSSAQIGTQVREASITGDTRVRTYESQRRRPQTRYPPNARANAPSRTTARSLHPLPLHPTLLPPHPLRLRIHHHPPPRRSLPHPNRPRRRRPHIGTTPTPAALQDPHHARRLPRRHRRPDGRTHAPRDRSRRVVARERGGRERDSQDCEVRQGRQGR